MNLTECLLTFESSVSDWRNWFRAQTPAAKVDSRAKMLQYSIKAEASAATLSKISHIIGMMDVEMAREYGDLVV